MKKIISLFAVTFLLVSCGSDKTPEVIDTPTQEENQNETVIDTPTDEEVISDEDQNETSTGTIQEELNSEENQEDTTDETYQETPTNWDEQTTATGTQVEIDAEANAEISGSEEEQLIEETMDELLEFFELLEETNE